LAQSGHHDALNQCPLLGVKRTSEETRCNACFWHKADIPFRRIESPAGSACYFFIIIFIRHETTAAARWALPLIVRTLFNDAITVAVWTGFHVYLPVATPLNPLERRQSDGSDFPNVCF
jgi:hypothetical protein